MRHRIKRYSVISSSAFAAVCSLGAAAGFGQTAQQQAAQSPRIASGREPAQAPTPQARPITNSGADVGTLYQKSGGSLLRTGLATASDPNQAKLSQVSYTALADPEPKTIRKHDLITIVIHEESAFTAKGTADLKREADVDAQLDAWARLNINRLLLAPGSLGGSGGNSNVPEVKMTGTRNFTGEGSVDRADTLTTRITGEVVDVKPNGTLVIQARKQIKTDDEEQQFILSGTCRAEDVAADNTVLSTQIFDLKLQNKNTGTVREGTRRTWLQKLFDIVSPF